MNFNITLAENHDSYDVVVAEFNITPDEAFDIIERYVYETDKRKRFLNKIIESDKKLDEKQKHMREMEELEKIIRDVNDG